MIPGIMCMTHIRRSHVKTNHVNGFTANVSVNRHSHICSSNGIWLYSKIQWSSLQSALCLSTTSDYGSCCNGCTANVSVTGSSFTWSSLSRSTTSATSNSSSDSQERSTGTPGTPGPLKWVLLLEYRVPF